MNDHKSLEVMFRNFVQPSMEYANTVWGVSYSSDILKLANIHLNSMQFVIGTTARSNIINVYEQVGGYTVNCCIKFATLTMVVNVVRVKGPKIWINILLDLNGNIFHGLTQT